MAKKEGKLIDAFNLKTQEWEGILIEMIIFFCGVIIFIGILYLVLFMLLMLIDHFLCKKKPKTTESVISFDSKDLEMLKDAYVTMFNKIDPEIVDIMEEDELNASEEEHAGLDEDYYKEHHPNQSHRDEKAENEKSKWHGVRKKINFMKECDDFFKDLYERRKKRARKNFIMQYGIVCKENFANADHINTE